MRRSFLLAMILLFLIGVAISQPTDPYVLYGTISSLEHTAPAEECFKISVIYPDSTIFVPDFGGYGADYIVEDGDTMASWAITITEVEEGDVITLRVEDTCLLEYLYIVEVIGDGSSTDLGHLVFSDYYGDRASVVGHEVVPATGTIDLDYTFSVDYSHPTGLDPVALMVYVDDIAYDIETVFPVADYTLPAYFELDIPGTTFGKGTHTYYYYAEDFLGFPVFADTMTFEIVNTPPDQPEASLVPEMPFYNEDLTVVITNMGDDADGDDVEYEYDWFVDGALIDEETGSTLGDEYFEPWSVIEVIVTPFDGEEYGTDTVLTVTAVAPELIDAAVAPEEGDRGDEFTYSVTYRNVRDIAPASLALTIDDGDAVEMERVDPLAEDWATGVEYQYTTAIDDPSEHSFQIDAEDEEGHSASFEGDGPVIANEPPSSPTVELIADPMPASIRSTITCDASGSEDPEGDDVLLSYEWYVNGTALGLPTTTTEIDNAYFERGDYILCEVVASDGYLTTEPVMSDTLWIQNSMPNPPVAVTITPVAPFEMDDLTLTVTEEADDPDGDEIESYDYQWYLDDVLVYEGNVLPSEYTGHSETWTAEVRAFDGVDYSEPFTLEVDIRSPQFSDAYFTPDEGPFNSGDMFTFVAAYSNEREYDLERAWLIIDDTDTFAVSHYDAPIDTTEEDDSTGSLLFYEEGELFAAEAPVYGRGEHYYRFEGIDEFDNFIVDLGNPNPGPVIENDGPWIDSLYVSSDPEDDFSRNGKLVAMVFGNDNDLDELEYLITWYNDTMEIEGVVGDTLGPEHYERGDMIWFKAWAFDGIVWSDSAISEPIEVQNAAPIIDHFAIIPEFPTTESDLVLELEVSDQDDDGYIAEYTWLVDGEPTEYTNDTIFADMLVNDEIWTAIVGVSDGRDWTYDTTDIEIQNTAPELYDDISDTIAVVGVEYTMTLPVRDIDFDVLTFEIADGPEGLEIGAHTGIITWVPDTEGVFNVAVDVDDADDEIFIDFNIVVINDTTDILAPTNLRAESGYAGIIPLAWDEPALFEMVSILPVDFVGFEVFRKLTTDEDFSSIAIVSGLSYVDASATPETPYMYKVRAVYDGLESSFTDEVLATSGGVDDARWYSSFTYMEAPEIDGAFEIGEWDDAMHMVLDDVEIFVKNTNDMLYIGAINNADRNLNEDDRLLISLDDSYNRRFPSASPSDEGEYRIEMGEEDAIVSFQGIWGTHPYGIGRDPRVESDLIDGAAGTGVYLDTMTSVIYELAIPISFFADLEPEYIDAGTGDIIGLRVEVLDAESFVYNMVWPAGSNAENAESFGSLFLGEGFNQGDIYATPMREEIYLRSGSYGTLPLFIGNDGSGNINYNLIESYVDFMPEDMLLRAMEPVSAIVLCDEDMLGQQALAHLGYSYELYTDEYDFMDALAEGEFDIAVVTVEEPGGVLLDVLADFNELGGKVVIAAIELIEDSELWEQLGAMPYEDLGDISSAINYDDPENAIYRLPNPIAVSVERLSGGMEDFGDAMMAYADSGMMPALNLASFDRLAYPRNYAITISADETIIMNSFALKAMENVDGDDIPDGIELLANEIYYLAASSDIDWLSFTPENGNLATHEEDLITVGFDADGMDIGTYNGYIHIYSNDPDEPFIPVECIMHVGGAEPVEITFDGDTIETEPGGEFEVPIFINELAGMGVDMIEFTLNIPAEYISPRGIDFEMGEGTILAMNSDSVRIRIYCEEYFMARGHMVTITLNTDLTSPVGVSSYLNIENVITNVEDIDIADGDHKLIKVLGGDLDWKLKLAFSSHFEADTLCMGIGEGADNEYNEGIDELNAEAESWFDIYFDISEFDTMVFDLQKDIRSPMDDYIVWTIVTGDSAGKLEWTFRDEDTLTAMGNLLLNGTIDMKTIADYDYSAGETLIVVYSLNDSRTFTMDFPVGFTMFSVPVTNAMGFFEVDEVLPSNTGFWRFNSEEGIRNWESTDIIEPGIGYVVHFIEEATLEVTGSPVTSIALDLNRSWNLIGCTFGTVDFSAPVTDPEGAIMALPNHAFLYDDESRSYLERDELEAGNAYFTLATEDCILYLNSGYSKSTGMTVNREAALINVNGRNLEMGFGNEMYPVLPAVPGETYNPKAWIDADGIQAVSYFKDGDDIVEFEVTVNSYTEVVFDGASVPANWIVTVEGLELPATFERGGVFKVTIDRSQKPAEYEMLSSYPNPFNAKTRIDYTVPEASDVELGVFDVSGRLLRTLTSEHHEAGDYSVFFDGKTDSGSEIATGVYFVKIQTSTVSDVRSIMLVK